MWADHWSSLQQKWVQIRLKCCFLCKREWERHVFSPGHYLLVVFVDIAVSELLPTHLTFVRFVLSMNDLMGRHLIQTLEGAVADLTSIRSFLWVSKERCASVGVSSKSTWEMLSGENYCTWVSDHVALQLIGRDEFFVAGVAVEYFMYLQQKRQWRLNILPFFMVFSEVKNLATQYLSWYRGNHMIFCDILQYYRHGDILRDFYRHFIYILLYVNSLSSSFLQA